MLPEKEYIKLYKLTKKYSYRWNAAMEAGALVKADRLLRKITKLVGRATELENMWRLPQERRWTRAI
jgi:hypothetical protein